MRARRRRKEGWRGLRQGAVPHPLRYRAARRPGPRPAAQARRQGVGYRAAGADHAKPAMDLRRHRRAARAVVAARLFRAGDRRVRLDRRRAGPARPMTPTPSRAGKPARNWPRARSWRWPSAPGRPHAACRPAFIDAWRALLTDPAIDAAFRARWPCPRKNAGRTHGRRRSPALSVARDFLRAELGRQLAAEFRAAFDANQTPGEYSPRLSPPASAR